jgi:hypothetical protein
LCIYRKFVRIRQYDRLENRAFFEIDIRLREKLQFFANKANPLAMCAIRTHHIIFDGGFIAPIDGMNKFVQYICFA